ncbi:MAG: phosphatidylglycerophosphatase A [Gammaproteobacteria bacterium]|nr:phosphatidylglycerophosphatase A [Gammaproteobacteria bacterium]
MSTGGGIGLIPFAPGTFGSALGLCLYIFYAHLSYPNISSLLFFIALTLISFIAIYKSMEVIGFEDHKEIVVDEILAMMLVAHFIPPDPIWAIGAFCIFRLFDIAKPYPINLIDNNMKNPVGVIFDDLIAAGYSIILILLVKYLLI